MKKLIISIILLSGCGSYLDDKYPNPMIIDGKTYVIEKGKFQGKDHLSACNTNDFVFQNQETNQFMDADVDLEQCDFWGMNISGYGLIVLFYDRITNQYWYGLNMAGGNPMGGVYNYYWIWSVEAI